jgi:hypothetical protein
MPHVRSISGLRMAAKYVKNWYSLLPLYAKITSKTIAKFKDGRELAISQSNYLAFYEELYRLHLQDNGFRYITKNNATIVHTPGGLQLMIRRPIYSFVLDEIFLMKVYGEPDLRERSAIDIGTSLGDSTLYFASLGAKRVYGFEPDISLYELAKENVKLNNMDDRIQIYNTKATGESLRNLILQYELKNVFLKIDCEGCEYEVIENADDLTFEKIKDVVIEYHNSPKPLMQRLTRLGFKVRQQKEIILAAKDQLVS